MRRHDGGFPANKDDLSEPLLCPESCGIKNVSFPIPLCTQGGGGWAILQACLVLTPFPWSPSALYEPFLSDPPTDEPHRVLSPLVTAVLLCTRLTFPLSSPSQTMMRAWAVLEVSWPLLWLIPFAYILSFWKNVASGGPKRYCNGPTFQRSHPPSLENQPVPYVTTEDYVLRTARAESLALHRTWISWPSLGLSGSL